MLKGEDVENRVMGFFFPFKMKFQIGLVEYRNFFLVW